MASFLPRRNSRSAVAKILRLAQASATRPSIVLVTDPGPDPDDVKVLLVLGVLHKLGRVSLLAVVANGGGQPRARAALARCVLDYLGVRDVPVGIGSMGLARSPQPYEFALAGIEEADTRLEHGPELLLRTLRAAPPRSVRVVLISSLRDFADVIQADAAAVLESVHTVAIQGGLEPDPARPFGWRADSSVNNCFDMEAAEKVYAFCFETGLRMTVTSRFAVPLLPMQLARSFAERTNCPVMAYLAAAQSLGLEDLWVKLCEGQLPSRCDKAWFFATFCGEKAAQFEANHRQRLGKDASISQYLNGYVKPYDVIALMTVLPFCAHVFDGLGHRVAVLQQRSDRRHSIHVHPLRLGNAPARITCSPLHAQQQPDAHHLLLLTSEDELPQVYVLNLMRDTYHEVVLATRETKRRALLHMVVGPRLEHTAESSGGLSDVRLPVPTRFGAFGRRIAANRASQRGGPPASRLSESHLEKSLRGSFGIARVAPAPARPHWQGWSSHRWSPRPFSISPAPPMRAGPRRADEPPFGGLRSRLPMPQSELVQVLEKSLESARMRTRAVVTVATVASVTIVLGTFGCGIVDIYFTGRRSGIDNPTPAQLHDIDDGWALRTYFYVLSTEIGGCAIGLSLAPRSLDRLRALLVSSIAAAVVMSFGVWIHLLPFIRILRTPPDEYSNIHVVLDKQGRSPAFWHAVWATYGVLRVTSYCALWLFGLCYIAYMRRSARVVARALCTIFGVMMLLNGVSDMIVNVVLNISAGMPRAPWFWLFVIAQALVAVTIGMWMLLPASRITAQVTFARMGGRDVQSRPETALAAIIGYGSSLGECDPPALVGFALQVFEPVELTVASLRQMGAVLFAPPDELQRARTHWRVGRRHTFSAHGNWGRIKERVSPEDGTGEPYVVQKTADCYVLHSPEDDASRKLEALCEWVGQFEAKHGRAPSVWLNSLCVDPSLSDVELLEHMPAYLARSERLLLLATSHGITHLRNAVECYVFRALGGLVSNIDVAIVGAAPVWHRSLRNAGADVNIERAYASSIVSAFDTFHVMFTSASGETVQVRSRLLHAVELVGVTYFNTVVRGTVPRARIAGASLHVPAAGDSGAS